MKSKTRNPKPQTWRLLITPPEDGATNMAIDEAILYALAEGVGQPTLRFYEWNPPCLTLGYGQRSREVDEDACRELGYTWVRRPTGGRAILHTDELTYSIITRADDERITGGIVESYRTLSRGLLRGLLYLDAPAVQAKGDMLKNPAQGTACFDTPSHYEVTLNGKKLVGSAQVRRKGMVLQHGTLPLSGDITRIFNILKLDEAEKQTQSRQLLNHSTTLELELSRIVVFNVAAQALTQGFAETLNLNFIPSALTDYERQLVNQLRTEKYAADSWNRRR